MTARTVTWHCPPKTVLVGVDFGDASARALALAIAGVVAAGFDARLRGLHAERFEPPPYFTVEQIGQLTRGLGACDRPFLIMPPFGDESETDHDH